MQRVARKVNEENILLKAEIEHLKEENAKLREVLGDIGVDDAGLERALSKASLSSTSPASGEPIPILDRSLGLPEQPVSMILPANITATSSQGPYLGALPKRSPSSGTESLTSPPIPSPAHSTIKREQDYFSFVASGSQSSNPGTASSKGSVPMPASSLGLRTPMSTSIQDSVSAQGKLPIVQDIYGINSLYPSYQQIPQQSVDWQVSAFDPTVSMVPTAGVDNAGMQTDQATAFPYPVNAYYSGQNSSQGSPN
jgi:hypothetical protein